MIALSINPASGKPLSAQVSDAVCLALKDGTVAPLDKLPGEAELAETLSVNPRTVSRAYDLLKGKGIITQRRGKGTHVSPGALAALGLPPRRRMRDVVMLLGEHDLRMINANSRFIAMDILAGLSSALRPHNAGIRLATALTAEEIGPADDVDGVVLLHARSFELSLNAELYKRGAPMVSLWRVSHWTGVSTISYDRYHAGRLAAMHLVESGYRSVGFIGQIDRAGQAPYPKFVGAMDVFREHDVVCANAHIGDAGDCPGEASKVTLDMIRNGKLPEAFFVDSDFKAIEVVCALRAHGLEVPDDIGVMGFSDIAECADFEPALTTVRTPRYEIGRAAARMMLEWPRDGSVPDAVYLEPELVVRRSLRRG